MAGAGTARAMRRRGFSMVELLTVIGIIMILIAFILPVLRLARERALVTQCSANLHQIAIAFNGYLIESHNMIFWRSANIYYEGMDWCTWGGREEGNKNTQQDGLFNKIKPRPLNRYLSNKLEVFRCPSDIGSYADTLADEFDSSRFEWVGNSYNFNATGYPRTENYVDGAGLAGVKITDVKESSRTVLFYDAGMLKDAHWHPRYKGNLCLADGHVVFAFWPTDAPGEEYVWH